MFSPLLISALLLSSSMVPTLALPALGLDIVGQVIAPILGNDNPIVSTVDSIGIGQPGKDLVDVSALVNILGPSQCSATSVVGVFLEVDIPPLLHVCACIEVGNILDTRKSKRCPTCVANAEPFCDKGKCGCRCNDGFYRHHNGACLPISVCLEVGILSSPSNSGSSDCLCHSPYVSDSNGGCKLPPSANSRLRSSRRAKKAQLVMSTLDQSKSYHSSKKEMGLGEEEQEKEKLSDAYRCPDGEKACPLGEGQGYECLDTTTSLDSCGGCLAPSASGEPATGTNCLTIPGAVNVACVKSQCQFGSCFPGWRYVDNRCVLDGQ